MGHLDWVTLGLQFQKCAPIGLEDISELLASYESHFASKAWDAALMATCAQVGSHEGTLGHSAGPASVLEHFGFEILMLGPRAAAGMTCWSGRD